eukprot:Nitzschia sp. Nitz4//scaffold49_size126201//46367//47992//NITZ4_003638-RA/size126201-snap-gene-0.63-mRNA-1//-1//CDS//3329553137//6165//frame0
MSTMPHWITDTTIPPTKKTTRTTILSQNLVPTKIVTTMVSFAAHSTTHLSNENNPNSSSMEPLYDDPSGTQQEPRKTFEKSPHPNKLVLPEVLPLQEEHDGNHGQEQDVSMRVTVYNTDEGMDLMLQPCVTNVDSPQASTKNEQRACKDATKQAASSQQQQQQQQEQEQEQQEQEQEQEPSTGFEEWVASVETPESHVQSYLATKARRVQATEQFQLALEECLDGLHRAMTQEFLAESVGTTFNDNSSMMDEIEETIQATLHSNHRQRNHMWSKLEKANSNWEHQFKRMRATLVPPQLESFLEGSSSSPAGNSSDTTNLGGQHGGKEDCPANSGVMVEEETSVSDDKTQNNTQDTTVAWDELTSDERTGPVARSFLEARKKRRDAEDVLSNALDEIHAGLQADANEISQAIVTVFDQLQQSTSALEKNIEHNFVHNAKRRQDLELRLQESSKQTLGLLSGLMSRLAGNSSYS